jgi:hypothetical protein
MEINFVAFAEMAAVFGLVIFFGWRELRRTELARKRLAAERKPDPPSPSGDPKA